MGKYTYGPVPSRRLGRSLGIDIVSSKSCTANCIYCQIGSREPLPPIRKRFFPPGDIEADIDTAVAVTEDIDWLTFSGSGEPTLSNDLGQLVDHCKSIGTAPVCVLTNGTLLWMPSVRDGLSNADLVVPNLDAAAPELFKRIVRPHESITFDKYLDGMLDFSSEFEGSLHLEIVLVAGINDSDEHLHKLAEIVEKISPDGVWIGTIKRPPAETYVKPVSEETLLKAAGIIGKSSEIIHDYKSRGNEVFPSWDIAEKIIELLKRRPETAKNIAEGLSANYHETLKAISRLEESGEIIRKEKDNDIFFGLIRS